MRQYAKAGVGGGGGASASCQGNDGLFCYFGHWILQGDGNLFPGMAGVFLPIPHPAPPPHPGDKHGTKYLGRDGLIS